MQYGSIPIVSNSSSLPEVVADAGLTVPVQNPEAIADAMWQALTLTAKQRAKPAVGQRAGCAFQWSDSAQIVLDTLQKVAKNKSDASGQNHRHGALILGMTVQAGQ